MLSLVKPVEEEKALMDRFVQIGLGTEKPFRFDQHSAAIQDALKQGVNDRFADMEETMRVLGTDPLGSAKSFGTREFLKKSANKNFGFDDHYLVRTIAAHMGLYGNSGEEAIYPTYLVDEKENPLNAENNYTITFKGGQDPPVRAFWSLTMYDGQTQLSVRNPLDRYLLNSTMQKQFKTESDGSVVFYIQKDSPGKDLDPNWLPAPDGPFYLILRLYLPEQEVLDGAWTAPVLQKS